MDRTLPKRLQTRWKGSVPMVLLEYKAHDGRMRRDWVVDNYSEGQRMAETQQRETKALEAREQERRFWQTKLDAGALIFDVERLLGT